MVGVKVTVDQVDAADDQAQAAVSIVTKPSLDRTSDLNRGWERSVGRVEIIWKR